MSTVCVALRMFYELFAMTYNYQRHYSSCNINYNKWLTFVDQLLHEHNELVVVITQGFLDFYLFVFR